MRNYLITAICLICFVPLASAQQALYYRDIDFWSLEGIHPLRDGDTSKLPNFKIEKLDSTNRTIEFLKGNHSEKETYTWKDGCWITVKERYGTSTHVFQYILVSRNKILTFEYLSTLEFKEGKGPDEKQLDELMKSVKDKKHYLTSFSVFDSLGQTDYILNRKQKLVDKPDLNFDQKISSLKIETVIKRLYKIIEGVLITEKRTLQSDKEFIEVICYDLKDQWGYTHNLFWPLFFPVKVACQ